MSNHIKSISILLTVLFLSLFQNCGSYKSQDAAADAFLSYRSVITDTENNENSTTENLSDNSSILSVSNGLTEVISVINNHNAGAGSLREAIQMANENQSADMVVINFKLENNKRRICLQSDLSEIRRPMFIRGSSQPGYAGRPLIEISGSCGARGSGLIVNSDKVMIQGLAINNFPGFGVEIIEANQVGIYGNYIGTTTRGTQRRPNDSGGIRLLDSSECSIGRDSISGRNLISGNGIVRNGSSGHGITILGGSNNRIHNNFIGTDISGRRRLENTGNGIFIYRSASNRIGSSIRQLGNLISGNFFYGITVAGLPTGHRAPRKGVGGHTIQGNIIGLDILGTKALSNRTGINLHNSSNAIIGGSTPSARNIISGNVRHGVNIDGAPPNAQAAEPHMGNKGNSKFNRVIGNYIGTDRSGRRRLGTDGLPLGNGNFGVWLFHTHHAVIGGVTPGLGNLISGNGVSDPQSQSKRYAGIGISSAHKPSEENTYRYINLHSWDIAILGNKIGTDVSGQKAIPNTGHGIGLNEALKVRVGSSTRLGKNIIKFNRAGCLRNINSSGVTSSFAQKNILGNGPDCK